MAKDILMPQMGYDMTEGTIVRWVKRPGDRVHKGDVVAEIETDKATVEIEAFDSGTLLSVIAEPGQTVPVGQPIATLGEAGEQAPPPATPAPKAAAKAPATSPVAAAKPAAPPPPAAQKRQPPAAAPAQAGGVHASPLARRLAAELGVDLGQLTGTGPGGRVVAADVEAAGAAPAAGEAEPAAPSAAAPALPEGAEDIELSRLRQAIGRRMADSAREAPHFYVSVDCQAGALLALREKLNRRRKQPRVSINDLLVKAIALAVAQHPEVNAAFMGDRVRRFKRIDVGIAISTDKGLLSPPILDVGAKPVTQVATETRDLAERARGGHLKPDELGGGTITISNLGMFGVDQFLAILNPPQAMIISVGAATDRVIAVAGRAKVVPMVTLWAAADHRVLDGADVARYMATLKGLIEAPEVLGK